MFKSIKVHKLLTESVPNGRAVDAAAYYRQAKRALSMCNKVLSPAETAGFTLVAMNRLNAIQFDELTPTGQSLYRIGKKLMPSNAGS